MDGVLFDTKENMRYAWNDVNEKFKLRVNFKYYFKQIGVPFDKILKKLNIINNKKKI